MTFKTTFLFVVCVYAATSFFSCSKDAAPPAKATVYISGYSGNPAAYTLGAFWKDGTINKIQNSTKIKSIAVRGNDVYMLDETGYWKNENFIPLPNALGTTSFFISGADVYVSGFTTTSLNTSTAAAVYWKNGQLVNLTQNVANVTSGWTNSIFVSGVDVYIAGNIGINYGNESAVYWKNGIMTNISDGYNAKGIAVSGNDIYVAGRSLYNGDVYWKNGIQQSLGNSAFVNSMAVYNGDIYIVGYTSFGPLQAAYWKNGTRTILPDGVQATGIAVAGSDIYVSGSSLNNIAVYWKNGVVDTLGIGGATGISIKD